MWWLAVLQLHEISNTAENQLFPMTAYVPLNPVCWKQVNRDLFQNLFFFFFIRKTILCAVILCGQGYSFFMCPWKLTKKWSIILNLHLVLWIFLVFSGFTYSFLLHFICETESSTVIFFLHDRGTQGLVNSLGFVQGSLFLLTRTRNALACLSRLDLCLFFFYDSSPSCFIHHK